MFASIKPHFMTSAWSIRSSYKWISQKTKKLLAHSFGVGLAVGVFLVSGLCIVGWLLFENNNINETKAYRHLIPLVPVGATKECGAVGNSIPVASHPLQTDSSIKRLREPITHKSEI